MMTSLERIAFNWLLMKLFITGGMSEFILLLMVLEIAPLKRFKMTETIPPENLMFKLPMSTLAEPEVTLGLPALTPRDKLAEALVLLKPMVTEPEPLGMLGQIYKTTLIKLSGR